MDVVGRQAGNCDPQRGSSAQQGLHPEQLLCGACGSSAKSPIVAGAGKPGNRHAVVTVGGPETYGTAGAVAVSGMPSETPDDRQAAMRRCASPTDVAPHPANSPGGTSISHSGQATPGTPPHAPPRLHPCDHDCPPSIQPPPSH